MSLLLRHTSAVNTPVNGCAEVYLKPPSLTTQYWVVAERNTIDRIVPDTVNGKPTAQVTLITPRDSPYSAVSAKADSGSVVLNATSNPVGMIIPGGDRTTESLQDLAYVLSP
ncbi:hypothetical protein ONS95_008783 [Cadophora gregata]|uniref:uncharacterized protein n=1 Tax=Cadophora gregata TaxID=51156 RepID=UPI0026DCA441|nr:uncharacterized protein ONS95_008783 [Cadophora gregata]KAK0123782.1 hypothetical protein ONS95_008783 [Cadophora gregata]KAK0130126.1 hypothetical protein ONS96_000653 [Cadophora gregata f. sp. sojae]